MIDELAVPLGLVLLLPAGVVLLLGGRAAVLAMGGDRRLGAAAGPVLALAAWMGGVHLAAYAGGGFYPGAAAGTAAAVGAAAVVLVGARRRAPPAGPPLPAAVVAAACAFGVAVLLLGLTGTFFDELGNTQHLSISLQMLQGDYPPRHLAFPQHELRYHYGFDLLAAMLTAATRLPLWWAIDLATACGAGLSVIALWQLGETLVGRGRGFLAALLALLGGSTFLWIGLAAGLPWLKAAIVVGVAPFGVRQNPPVGAYLFQHPWSVGIPILAALALLAAEARRLRPAGLAAATFVLLVAASIGQIVVYAAASAALLAAAAALARSPTTRPAAAALVGADLAAILVVRHLGGFFARSAEPLALRWAVGMDAAWQGALLWNVACFGLPALLAAIGWRRRQGPGAGWIFLAALAAGGALVSNLVRYGLTWDIVKFGTLASVALAFFAANGVAWMVERRAAPLRALAVAAVALIVAPTTVWAVGRGVTSLREGSATPPAPSEEDRAAMRWLLAHVRPSDVVYRRSERVPPYGYWAALPNTAMDVSVSGFPLPPAAIRARREIGEPSADRDHLQRLVDSGVSYAVIEPAVEPALAATAARWTRRGRAAVRGRFGGLVVVELLPPAGAAAAGPRR